MSPPLIESFNQVSFINLFINTRSCSLKVSDVMIWSSCLGGAGLYCSPGQRLNLTLALKFSKLLWRQRVWSVWKYLDRLISEGCDDIFFFFCCWMEESGLFLGKNKKWKTWEKRAVHLYLQLMRGCQMFACVCCWSAALSSSGCNYRLWSLIRLSLKLAVLLLSLRTDAEIRVLLLVHFLFYLKRILIRDQSNWIHMVMAPFNCEVK